MQKLNSKKNKLQRGFTLLESMVAIAIFTMGISTAVFVITQSISVGTRTKNKIIAANLTQEGIEVVRNIRDRNWLAGRPWVDGIDALTNACLQWNSDNVAGFFIDTGCISGANLSFDGAHYVQTTSPAQFSRTVDTQHFLDNEPNPGDIERVRISVITTCGANCSVTAEDYLYNWK
ncbi:MAG: type II secretion system GspH family protein [Candidatus Azambacteria bacterium]|nr:type II secretion system GspH family protein [Candidatus Azambacteria bacterium]